MSLDPAVAAPSAAPRTAKRRRARWAVAALVAVVLVVAGVVGWPLLSRSMGGRPAAIATATASTGRLVVTSSADGAAEPARTADVYAEVAGTVADVNVEVGDRVKAGQTLFTVDDEELQDAIRSAKTQKLQANQQLTSARQQVIQAEYQVLQATNRLDDLESRPATQAATDSEIEEAEKNVAVAKAGLTSAKSARVGAQQSYSNAVADYDDAVADLEKVTVTAPHGGVVTAVNISEGGSVSTAGGSGGASSGSGSTSGGAAGAATGSTSSGSSSAPVVIADTSELVVTVNVNEIDIAEIEAGQEATITFDAVDELELPAKVSWVSPNATSDGSVSTYEVELTLAKQDKRIRNGMTASADIVTLSVADAVLVPKSSVKVDGAEKYVTVVGGDGSPQRRVVTTGPYDDEQIQVLAGLEDGEKVATTASSNDEQRGGGLMPPDPGGVAGGGPRMIQRSGGGN